MTPDRRREYITIFLFLSSLLLRGGTDEVIIDANVIYSYWRNHIIQLYSMILYFLIWTQKIVWVPKIHIFCFIIKKEICLNRSIETLVSPKQEKNKILENRDRKINKLTGK